MTNPFQSPAETPSEPSLVSKIALPALATGAAVVVGGFLLLLQNGQVFTNGLICLGLFGVSGALWGLLALTTPSLRRFALIVLAMHAIVVLALAVTLPSKRAFQNDFNAKMEEIWMRRTR